MKQTSANVPMFVSFLTLKWLTHKLNIYSKMTAIDGLSIIALPVIQLSPRNFFRYRRNNREMNMKAKIPALAMGAFFLFAGIVQASVSLDIPVSSGGSTSSRHLNYYAPANLNNPPLVVLMHGAQGNGENLAEAWGWDSIAMREKFVVATPSSVGSFWDLGGSSDIDFVLAIIDTMANRFHIDRNRVYATGWSMGGMMSHYLACHTPEKIAAIGPSSGYLLYGQSGCSTARNVPIYHIHGIWDDFVKYSDLHAYLKNNWLDNYGCPAVADSSKPGLGATLLESWDNCSKDGKNSEVYLESYWKAHGIGPEEAEVFWNFLHKYSLNASPLPSVVLYQRTNSQGQLTKLTEGSYTHIRLSKVGLPDSSVSSIKVASGLTIEFFDNDNFQNPLATYSSDAGDLSAIKNKITAIRISSKPVDPIPVVLGATFFQLVNFGGLNAKLPVGDYTMAQLNAAGIPDNAVSSMKVDAGLVVDLFDGDNFQSSLGEYDANQPDFGSIGAGSKVTSVRISLKGPTLVSKYSGVILGVTLSWQHGNIVLNLEKPMTGRVEILNLSGSKSDVLAQGTFHAGENLIISHNLAVGAHIVRFISAQGGISQTTVMMSTLKDK